jgi:hypothetical protein
MVRTLAGAASIVEAYQKRREFDAKSAKFCLVVLDEILFFTRVEVKALKGHKEMKKIRDIET